MHLTVLGPIANSSATNLHSKRAPNDVKLLFYFQKLNNFDILIKVQKTIGKNNFEIKIL